MFLQHNGDEKYRNEAPKDSEPKEKKWKGKTYHYCSNHSYWCMHKTMECNKSKSPNANIATHAADATDTMAAVKDNDRSL